MNKISCLKFFNSPKPECEIRIDVLPDKNFLILTGYNGSGKSRILNIIHESLSLVRDYNYPGPGINWASDIYFDEGFRVRSIKLVEEGAYSDAANAKVGQIIKKQIPLDDFFEQSYTVFNKKGGRATPKSDSETDELKGFAWSALQKVNSKIDNPSRNSIESVLYIEEKIHFNFKRKTVDTVFSNNQGIDQTIYILINELVAKTAIKNGINEKITSLFNSYIEANKEWSKDDVKKFVAENLDAGAALNEGNPIESTEAFLELNKFFAMTNRQLVWRDDSTFMKIGDDLINWVEFSKGEKTLITLVLIAYLYQETAAFIFDEPDLSLHMEWQKMLLPTLLRIAPKAQFIISTHSPFMVMNTDSEQIVNMAKLYSEARK